MSERERAAAPEELPTTRALLKLIRVMVAAHLATAPPKQAKAFVRAAEAMLADEAKVTMLFPIRPGDDREADAAAHMEAIELYRAMRPALAARLGAG